MYTGDGYLEKPEFEQGAEPSGLEAKLGQTEDVTRNPHVPDDIENVPLDQINNPDIRGPGDFASPAEYASYRREAEMLDQMQPALEQGAGPETWDAWDQHNQIGAYTPEGYTRGYTDVYQGYYKNDTIALEQRGDQYEILNGRHRVYVAQEAGFKTVPARVQR